MQVEVLKKDPDHRQIDELMSATFSMRRKEIVGDQPLIGDVMAKWPAMFCERQVQQQTTLTETEINHLIQFCFNGCRCVSLPPGGNRTGYNFESCTFIPNNMADTVLALF